MLKAIQILGCSSSLVTQRWKPLSSPGLPSIAVSFKPFSSFYSVSLLEALPTMDSRLLHKDSNLRTQSRSIHASSSRSDSNPDGTSSPPSSSSLAAQSSGIRNIKFCQWCGGPTKHDVPEGEERLRAICTICEKGIWRLESAMESAIRETREEANAEVEVLSPFAQLDIPLIGQTYIIFLAKLKKPHFSPGPESSECRLFLLDDVPFDSLSFSLMVFTLNMYAEDIEAGKLKFHYGIINKRPGTSPSDIHAYTLDDHMES